MFMTPMGQSWMVIQRLDDGWGLTLKQRTVIGSTDLKNDQYLLKGVFDLISMMKQSSVSYRSRGSIPMKKLRMLRIEMLGIQMLLLLLNLLGEEESAFRRSPSTYGCSRMAQLQLAKDLSCLKGCDRVLLLKLWMNVLWMKVWRNMQWQLL